MSLFTSITNGSNFGTMNDLLLDETSLEKLSSLINIVSPPRALEEISLEKLNDVAYAVCNALTPEDDIKNSTFISPEDGAQIVKLVYATYVRWFCENNEYKPMVEKREVAEQVDESLSEISRYGKMKYDILLPGAIIARRLSELYPAALIILPSDSKQMKKINAFLEKMPDLKIEKWSYECAIIQKVYPFHGYVKKHDSWEEIKAIIEDTNGVLLTLYENTHEQTCHQSFAYHDYLLDSQKKYLEVVSSSLNAVNRLFFSILSPEYTISSENQPPLEIQRYSSQAIAEWSFGAIQVWSKLYENMFQNEQTATENLADKDLLFKRFKPFRDQMNKAVSMRNRYIFA